ncbi:MAG: TAXI family TRAP transporter solute-binding subunit, partial [Microcystaceae cyanobacterium]
MQESMQNKLALPIVLISIVMAGVFSVQWFRHQNRVHSLLIATGGKNGEYYAFGQAIAKVINKHQPQIQIEVLETEGSLQNQQLVEEKKVQLALVQNDTPLGTTTQAVSILFPEMFHLIVTKQSGIKNISDLKGKRIALMPKGSGSYALFWPLSQHYGLKPTNFKAVNLSPEQAYAA